MHFVGNGWEGVGSNKKARYTRANALIYRAYVWLRGQDLNLRPSGYEPDELPGCSTPRWFVLVLEDHKTALGRL